MIVGGVLTLINSYIYESWFPIPIFDLKKYTITIIITAMISNIICYNLFGFLLKKFTVTFMTFTGMITPIFSMILGNFFLNEKINYNYIISILLFLIGLKIFYNQEIKFNEKN